MSYPSAREQFSRWGVNTEAALESLGSIPLSLHCWQGDDVGGFETGSGPGAGFQATGGYPGRARTIEELQADLDHAASLIPGRLRLNLHAIYADYQGRKIGRDALTVEHFEGWIQWARQRAWGIDFNPTCFAHPLAEDDSLFPIAIRLCAGSGSTIASPAGGLARPSGVLSVRPR